MTHNRNRHRLGHYFDLPPRWRWVAWPVWVLGGVAVAIGLWLEGLEACLPLAILLAMGVLLCAFDYLCFRAARARPEDKNQPDQRN